MSGSTKAGEGMVGVVKGLFRRCNESPKDFGTVKLWMDEIPGITADEAERIVNGTLTPAQAESIAATSSRPETLDLGDFF